MCILEFLIIMKTHTEKDKNKQGGTTEVLKAYYFPDSVGKHSP